MHARTTVRSLARLGWTAALVALALLVAAVPASAKGPPNGKGGPPPWAGGSGGSGGGPPPWAGAGKGGGAQKANGGAEKAEKGPRKAAKKAAKTRERSQRGERNPAMTCFVLIGELGEAFYETYGTNPNGANAFGKCVSEHAREQGGDDGDEPAEDEAEEPTECEEPAEGEEPSGDGDPVVELASFDETTPDEEECASADEEPASGDEGGDEGDEEVEPALACFLPLAARANPFAVCVRA